MSFSVKASVKKKKSTETITKMIGGLAGAIVMKHALGMATALYQVYPVGVDHPDGTPHTRDTFAIVKDGKVLASHGQFGHASEKYEFSKSTASQMTGKGLQFVAAGAAFFVEFGTIHMEARPIIRQQIKLARQHILNELRHLNIKMSQI